MKLDLTVWDQFVDGRSGMRMVTFVSQPQALSTGGKVRGVTQLCPVLMHILCGGKLPDRVPGSQQHCVIVESSGSVCCNGSKQA